MHSKAICCQHRLRYFIKDKVLLTTEKAIEKRLDLFSFHSDSSVLFPSQRPLSLILFVILICFTALCASVR